MALRRLSETFCGARHIQRLAMTWQRSEPSLSQISANALNRGSFESHTGFSCVSKYLSLFKGNIRFVELDLRVQGGNVNHFTHTKSAHREILCPVCVIVGLDTKIRFLLEDRVAMLPEMHCACGHSKCSLQSFANSARKSKSVGGTKLRVKGTNISSERPCFISGK